MTFVFFHFKQPLKLVAPNQEGYRVEDEGYIYRQQELRRNGGGVKEESFWELRRRVSGKQNEVPTQILNNKGELVSEKQKIVEVFKDFYIDLFKKPVADLSNLEQKMAE